MKKRFLLTACLIPLLVWLLVPLLVRYPGWVVSKMVTQCEKGVADESCAPVISALGQSGDMFGVAASLFSGLALFAVAVTLWFDYSARRASRKPLLVCTIDETKELAFDDPHHTQPRSVRLRVSVNVKAVNDTALNTSVSATFKIGDFSLILGEKHVQVPLLDQQSAVLEFFGRVNDASIAELIAEINASKPMTLSVIAKCNSMEELSWTTSVVYKLRFENDHVDMIRKLQHDEAALLEAWQGGAAVRLLYEIEPGSWKHKKLS